MWRSLILLRHIPTFGQRSCGYAPNVDDDRATSSAETEFPPLDASGVAGRMAVAVVLLTAGLLALGTVGHLAVFDAPIGDAESDLVRWVADHRIGVLDTAATVGSSLTDTWVVIGVLVGSVTVLVAVGHRRYAGVLLIGVGLELISFLAVGAVIDRSRPAAEALHSVPSTPSFPSGHVAAAVVLYGSLTFTALAIRRPGRLRAPVWIAPAVVSVVVASSRVYEGVHYPTDVVAGFVLGAGALYGAVYTLRLTGQIPGQRSAVPRSTRFDDTERTHSHAMPAWPPGQRRS
jgi:undecaprenyl-diphosphatase